MPNDVDTVVDDLDLITKEGDKWCVTVDLGDGTHPQKFFGDTRADVIKELVKAQTNATKTIREQKKRLKLETPDAPRQIPEFKARQLTADEKFRLANEINDPAKATDAIRRAIEAEFGAPAETIRKTLSTVHEREARAANLAIAQAFQDAHPEYKMCPENEQLMLEYLQSRSMGFTLRNLEVALDDLRDHLDLTTVKSQTVSTPVTRPRGSASTGIPANAGSSRPPAKKVELTVAEVNRMSAAEYRLKLADPTFRAAVDKLNFRQA